MTKNIFVSIKKLSISQKSNAEILTSVMKSVCVNIIYLYEYDNYCEYASDNVLEALNLFNSFKVDDSSIKKIHRNFIKDRYRTSKTFKNELR